MNNYPHKDEIELYHIVHIDKLSPILSSGKAGQFVCDKDVQRNKSPGTTIGMGKIKERRINELTLNSYPDLHVGDCVPFYFCPRSVMLYMFYQNNHHDLTYRGGQTPIVHLVFGMKEVVEWAAKKNRRWVFTDSNAGSRYFNDYCDLSYLSKLDWNAIRANSWRDCKDKKQAEFLIEKSLPWCLVKKIGVYSQEYYDKVHIAMANSKHKPPVLIEREWYY